MTKICFPHYKKGEFASLTEALEFLNRETNSIWCHTLCDIVKYNICYRNHLRRYGVEELIIRLTEEAPQLKDENALLHRLCEWATKEMLADYDIQCYNVNDKVTILGHTFNGLKDIREHVELYGRDGYDGLYCFAPSEKQQYDDVHIGSLYENYPVFDIYDLADDRTYQNYIFRQAPISEDDMKMAFKTYHKANFCMVHEAIHEEMLPILYYRGDGKYMLLATNKSLCDDVSINGES